MKILASMVIGLFLLFFQGCGSSKDNTVSGTQEFRFFNGRNVTEDMDVILKKNAIVELNTSIGYGKDESTAVSWVENDTFEFYYSQSDITISVSDIEPINGMQIMVSIGNDTEKSLPLVLDGPGKNDLISNRAIVKVINAMRGDTDNHINDELVLQIRNQSIYDSDPLKLGDVADTDKVIGSAKSLVTVLDNRGNELYQDTYDILNGKAYAIIMYEKQFDDNQPTVYFFDVTP